MFGPGLWELPGDERQDDGITAQEKGTDSVTCPNRGIKSQSAKVYVWEQARKLLLVVVVNDLH